MSLKRFIVGNIIWGLCVGCAGLFLFILACFYLPSGPNPFFLLLSFGLLAMSLLVGWPAVRWINLIKTRHRIGYQVVLIPVPGRNKIEFDLAGIKSGTFVVFFNNVGPETVSGHISLSFPAETKDSCVSIKLEEPEFYTVFGKKKWGRSTGGFFPLKIPFSYLGSEAISSELRFDLEWNFEGTYLRYLLPKNRQIKAEIFAIAKPS